jgi:hypothetical protein
VDTEDRFRKKLKSSIKHVTYEDVDDHESLKDDLQSELESEYENIVEADEDMIKEKESSRPSRTRRVRLRVLKLKKICKTADIAPV